MKISDTLDIKDPFYASPVFLSNLQAEERIVVNQGGTWSGKTFSILQALFLLTVTTKYYNEEGQKENIITTIVGQDVPNLTKGAITDFQNILEMLLDSLPESVHYLFNHRYNSTKKTYYFANGSRLEFSSFKNWQDAKSGKRHFLFINEANGVPYKIYQQLQMRTRIRTFLDYNPDAPFWVHHHLKGKEGVKMIYSNLSHNKFVPDDVRKDLLALGEANKEFKKVYILGKTGATEGIIFPNVNWVQDMPDVYKKQCYGIDFGFTNDPTTLVRVVLSEGKLYAQCLIYQRGLTSSDIVEELQSLGIKKTTRIFADGASPMTIAELQKKGYRKVIGAKKGAGSVKAGIDLVKSYGTLNVVDNIHWRAEQLAYKWKEDRMSGEPTNEPEDKDNHLWDALRYAMQGISMRKRGGGTYK